MLRKIINDAHVQELKRRILKYSVGERFKTSHGRSFYEPLFVRFISKYNN